MFKKLRPGEGPGKRTKGETDAGAPQDRAAPRGPSHLKFVDPARAPSRGPAPRVAAAPVSQTGAAPGAGVRSFGRLMLVGPRIRLNGEIRACERLVVEGLVEGDVRETERLEVLRGGRFHGSAQVGTCLVDGDFEGELDVHGVLTLKANGRIAGTVRYGEIEIERGGVIAGTFGARGAAEGTGQPAAHRAGRPPSARPLKASGPRPA